MRICMKCGRLYDDDKIYLKTCICSNTKLVDYEGTPEQKIKADEYKIKAEREKKIVGISK